MHACGPGADRKGRRMRAPGLNAGGLRADEARGHGIPCDPYDLLWGLREVRATAQVLERAMEGIAARPHEVAARELLEHRHIDVACARVLSAGVPRRGGRLASFAGGVELSSDRFQLGPKRRSGRGRRPKRLGRERTCGALVETKVEHESPYDLVVVVTAGDEASCSRQRLPPVRRPCPSWHGSRIDRLDRLLEDRTVICAGFSRSARLDGRGSR
jgi:hypothetical protein